MCCVIPSHKLLKLEGVEWRSIVAHPLVRDTMSEEMPLEFKVVDLKVFRVVIHSAEVITIFKVKDVTTSCFPVAAWDLV